MRPIHVSVIAGLSVATLGICQAEVEGEVHVGLSNEYVWRGIDQGGGSMAEAGLNLSTDWAGWDFGAGIWYASVHGSDSFDEVDYFASVGKSWGAMNFEVGYIYYDFPSSSGPDVLNGELYFTVGTQAWDTDFAFTYFWDVDGDNDGYSELTIDRSFDLTECVALAVGGTVSFDWETTDLHHWGLSASLDWSPNDIVTISPYVSATFAEDGAKTGALSSNPMDDYYYSYQGDEVFGGVVVTASF